MKRAIFMSLMAAIVLMGCNRNDAIDESLNPNEGVGSMDEGERRGLEPQDSGTVEQNDLAWVIELKNGGEAQCEVTDKAGKMVTYLVKGERVRASGFEYWQGGTANMIIDETSFYFWKDGETTGYKMEKAGMQDEGELERLALEHVREVPNFSSEASVREMQAKGYEVKCNQAEVSDEVFAVPQGVSFIDLKAQLEEKVQQTAPESTADFEEQLKMLQQMGN